jgi:hypothetical protein
MAPHNTSSKNIFKGVPLPRLVYLSAETRQVFYALIATGDKSDL